MPGLNTRENKLYLLHFLVKKKKQLESSHQLPTDQRWQKTPHKKITSDKHLYARIKKLLSGKAKF